MSDLRLTRAINNPVRGTNDDQWMNMRGTRDGALFTASWFQALSLEGRVFACGIGTLSDGEALPAAVITTLRPMLWVRVPSGTTIMPVYASLQLEAATGQLEAMVAIDQADMGNGTSSAADYGPLSLRTDAPVTSNCTCRQEATGDVTAETNLAPVGRLYHDDSATNLVHSSLWEWKPPVAPVVVGPSTFAMYIGGSAAPTVTAQIIWAEVPSTDVV
ncbi:MAG: hypothetical protein V3S82_07625 [Dehalococcoidia bacterium]